MRDGRLVPSLCTCLALLAASAPAADAGLVLDPPDPASTRVLEGSTVPLPEATVSRVPSTFGPYAAGFDCRSRTLYLPLDAPPYLIMHEAGHVFDCVAMDDGARAAFRTIMGYRPAWGVAAERFADAYSACALGPPRATHVTAGVTVRTRPYSPYGYRPTRRQHRRVCALIRGIGTASPPLS